MNKQPETPKEQLAEVNEEVSRGFTAAKKRLAALNEKVSSGRIAAMLGRVKEKALAPAAPKRKRKRDSKHAAKHVVRKRVKMARKRNRR